LFLLLAASGTPAAAEDVIEAPADELPFLDPSSPDYRTPRAGEGFRTEVFGRDVKVDARDRRSTSAWDLGAALWYPEPEGRFALPFAALYFWRRYEERFLRATISGLYNDVVYAQSLANDSPFEVVLGFENNTVPTESSERIDGERFEDEELLWGSVRGAVGLGWRRQITPGFRDLDVLEYVNPQAPDNMISVSATVEPKYLFFGGGHNSNPFFQQPQDTFELQGRLAMRWDAMERNLLDLSHEGYALGFDGILGWRSNWEDWGVLRSHDADHSRRPRLLQSYVVAASGIPGLESDRHRLIGSIHGGWGERLDRFSAPRLGGGPGGNEFLSLARPNLPGATISEFYPDHYAVGIAEYRYEVFFFTYVGVRGSLGWLDRDRLVYDDDEGPIRRQNDVMSSVGGRLTTGFFFKTRLQLDYNYNFDLIRDGNRGGNELVIHVSGSF
jgi:hypothetical protein